MSRWTLTRSRIQTVLGLVALAGMIGATFIADLPSPSEYVALLVSAGLIAVCVRFPIVLRQTELILAHAIGISILVTFGVAPAAWMMLTGLLLGELWWFFAPGQPPTPERPARLGTFRARFVQQMVPLVLAGSADAWLTQQLGVAREASDIIQVTLFALLFLVIYNGLLGMEVEAGPGTAAQFFRENIGAVMVVELLPLPLVVFAALQSSVFGSNLLLIIGGVLAVLALRLYSTSWMLLHQTYALDESRRSTDQARQRADNLNRQLTVASAKLELTQHELAALAQRARHSAALAQVSTLLQTAPAGRPPYEAILRQLAEAVGATLAQFGLAIAGSQNFSFVAGFGLSPERAAQERSTVWLRDHGLPGRALSSGQPIRSGNVAAEPAYVESFPGVRSELCVPMVSGGRRMGLIRLLSRQPDAFSSGDEAFVVQAANLIALALDNSQLQEEARVRQKENAILIDTGVKLAATLDIRAVYRAIVQKLVEAVVADSCTLAEIDPVGSVMRLTEPRSPKTFPPDEYPAIARAVAERKPVLQASLDTSLTPQERETLQAEAAEVVAIVPMMNGPHVVGVTQLYSQTAREFSPSDLYIAQMLANQAAVALQNARLFHTVTEGRDRLAAILDSTREGVLVIDASGLISLVNPPLVEFWGIPSHRLLGQHLLALADDAELNLGEKLGLPRDEIEELLLTLRAGLALSIPKVQYALYTPRPRFLERTGAPVLDQFAKAIGWVVILRDITEERELQQVRDTLANMIVHDLRSPLTSMLAGVSLIRDRLPKEQQTPLIKQSIDVAIRSGNKMLDLVNTLLDLSRMEAGELVLKRAPLQLDLVVDEVLSDLTPLANDQGLVLINDVPPGLPLVPADREKLSRVFTNLLDNALKFSPPGGQVTVRAQAQPNGDSQAAVTCAVIDTGPGIPDEYLARVFDRFVQVEGRKGRRQGTGLGLAFCKMAVEAHGGRIWVENRSEGGSAFFFTLPVEG